MEHHCCYKVYITKTRVTCIHNKVFFKHQYIMNPKVSPEKMVIQAGQRLTSPLQGTIAPEIKTVEALRKVSELFTKLVVAKAAGKKGKGATKQTQNSPRHMPRHTTSKGGSVCKLGLHSAESLPQ